MRLGFVRPVTTFVANSSLTTARSTFPDVTTNGAPTATNSSFATANRSILVSVTKANAIISQAVCSCLLGNSEYGNAINVTDVASANMCASSGLSMSRTCSGIILRPYNMSDSSGVIQCPTGNVTDVASEGLSSNLTGNFSGLWPSPVSNFSGTAVRNPALSSGLCIALVAALLISEIL